MEITRPMWVSLTIAAIYILITLMAMGPLPAAGCTVATLFPLVMIWFPDELGSYTGGAGHGQRIDQESPPWAVAGLGWIFLIGGPIVLIWLASRR